MIRNHVIGLVLVVCACSPQAEIRLHATQSFSQRLRPTQAGALFSFDANATIASYDSTGGRFKIWYATDTADAVPSRDDDSSGVPDYVEEVAVTFEDVMHFYVDELGFAAPIADTDVNVADDGGDARFDVYLVDFDGAGDGVFGVDGCLTGTEQCAGHMALENDFVGYGYPSRRVAIRILSSHEFFHAIQAAYDSEQDTWWTESTAVWGEEQYDPSLDDFEAFVPGYLDDTGRSLDVPPVGSVDAFSYGLAIWPQFLSEKFDNDVVRTIWQDLVNGSNGIADPDALAVTDQVLQTHYQSSFGQAFGDFAVWNLRTDLFADPTRAYQNGAEYPLPSYEWSGTLPIEAERLRVYHASIQYFFADPEQRSQLVVGFQEAPPPELKLAVVLQTGPERSDPMWIQDLDSTTPSPIDIDGADYAILIVVNTALDGDSARPHLCFGSPEEVKICRFGEDEKNEDADENKTDDTQACGCSANTVGLVWGSWCVPLVWLTRRRHRLHLSSRINS